MTTGPLNPDENPFFANPDNIPVKYWERLQNKDFSGVSGIQSEGHIVRLVFLYSECVVDLDKRKIILRDFPFAPNFQIYLVILHYLFAVPFTISGKDWVIASELKGGLHFFAGSHPLTVDVVLNAYQNDTDEMRKSFLRLGADPLAYGDIGFTIEVLSGISLRYIYWKGDEDFPPSLTINFRQGIEYIMHLDVVWAMVNVVNHTIALLKKQQ